MISEFKNISIDKKWSLIYFKSDNPQDLNISFKSVLSLSVSSFPLFPLDAYIYSNITNIYVFEISKEKQTNKIKIKFFCFSTKYVCVCTNSKLKKQTRLNHMIHFTHEWMLNFAFKIFDSFQIQMQKFLPFIFQNLFISKLFNKLNLNGQLFALHGFCFTTCYLALPALKS